MGLKRIKGPQGQQGQARTAADLQAGDWLFLSASAGQYLTVVGVRPLPGDRGRVEVRLQTHGDRPLRAGHRADP